MSPRKKIRTSIEILLLLSLIMLLGAINEVNASSDALTGAVTVGMVTPSGGITEVEIIPPDGADVAWCYLQEFKHKREDGTFRNRDGIARIWCKFFNNDRAWWEIVFTDWPEENRV